MLERSDPVPVTKCSLMIVVHYDRRRTVKLFNGEAEDYLSSLRIPFLLGLDNLIFVSSDIRREKGGMFCGELQHIYVVVVIVTTMLLLY